MSRKFLTNVDLNNNQLVNAVVTNSAPGSPIAGNLWFSSDHLLVRGASATKTLANQDDTFYIGTTSVALNRTSGTQTLTGVTAESANKVNAALTMNNGGGGAASGSSFDGSGAVTLSYNTIGAAPLVSPTFTGTVTVPDPTNATDAANKKYVDAAVAGIDWKSSVLYGTAAALTTGQNTGGTVTVTYANGSSGVGATLTIATSTTWNADGPKFDGFSVTVTGTRILVKDQATTAHNGIYQVTTVGLSGTGTSHVLTRTTDADTAAELSAGFATFIEAGTTLADTGWVMNGSSPSNIGTDAITFTQFTGVASLTASGGLTKSGNDVSITGFSGSTPYTANKAIYSTSTSALTSGTLPYVAGGTNATSITDIIYPTATGAGTQTGIAGSINTVVITAATAGSTTVYTAASHGFTVGQVVNVSGITWTGTGNGMNGTYSVTAVTTNTFTTALNSTGATYTAGGLGIVAYNVTRKIIFGNPSTGIHSSGIVTWVITHNLASRDLFVAVRETATNAKVETDVTFPSDNTVQLVWNAASAPAQDAYKVTVIG